MEKLTMGASGCLSVMVGWVTLSIGVLDVVLVVVLTVVLEMHFMVIRQWNSWVAIGRAGKVILETRGRNLEGLWIADAAGLWGWWWRVWAVSAPSPGGSLAPSSPTKVADPR